MLSSSKEALKSTVATGLLGVSSLAIDFMADTWARQAWLREGIVNDLYELLPNTLGVEDIVRQYGSMAGLQETYMQLFGVEAGAFTDALKCAGAGLTGAAVLGYGAKQFVKAHESLDVNDYFSIFDEYPKRATAGVLGFVTGVAVGTFVGVEKLMDHFYSIQSAVGVVDVAQNIPEVVAGGVNTSMVGSGPIESSIESFINYSAFSEKSVDDVLDLVLK